MAVTPPKAPWYAGSGGVTQFTRAEAQSFARGLLTSSTYREELKSRLEKGSLPPALEQMLWHYAFGKPPEEVSVTVSDDLSSLSTEQLAQRAEFALRALKEAKALEEALDIEKSA